ncbi:predicted protein [Sclerotinia sclerotiorum 1980 UF-70]|uniref:Uncharacterized protein n=1 Tax=Sclerotinia sclerotiorum (strain ATCC 18683 / 1980 / Ss-1) TaxID=665079 RepID=A7E6F8_SCLS1|nr:predicted protein [Sclerotinia sclerotiorum 1980 UF-70]EDN91480.1 predicted protein [Sclerotinia sclerotiorum 1980 UF-70]
MQGLEELEGLASRALRSRRAKGSKLDPLAPFEPRSMKFKISDVDEENTGYKDFEPGIIFVYEAKIRRERNGKYSMRIPNNTVSGTSDEFLGAPTGNCGQYIRPRHYRPLMGHMQNLQSQFL